jgi:PAS domain S-box-containing protein
MLAKAEEERFNVKLAPRLSTGLERLGEEQFDVVLLSLTLPDSSGVGTLAKLRDKAPDVPVVVITGPKEDEGPNAMAQGAYDYVTKGRLNISVLAHAITYAIERGKAEKEPGYGDRRFRALIENASDGVAILDPKGNTRYASPSFIRISGCSETEEPGASAFECLHPDDKPKVMQILKEVSRKPGASMPNEMRFKHTDDSWHDIEAVVTNHLDDPAVGGIVVNIRDVTERKRAEEEYRVKMEFYKRLIEHVMDGITVLGADGTVQYLSPATEQQYGYKAEEFQGQFFFKVAHPDDVEQVTKTITEVTKTPGASATAEMRFKHPDGTWHWVEAVGTNCLDDPVLKGLVVVTRDITDRKTMEEALRKSESELKEALEKLRLLLEEVSTPVVQIWNRILALPLTGVIDDNRAQQIMDVLLTKITQTRSEIVILDVTGVPSMDTMVINHLMRTIQSASMLGTECVLTGMKPELAQSVVQLDLDFTKFVIKRDMQEGLKWALLKMGRKTAGGHSSTEASPPEQAQTTSLRKGSTESTFWKGAVQ